MRLAGWWENEQGVMGYLDWVNDCRFLVIVGNDCRVNELISLQSLGLTLTCMGDWKHPTSLMEEVKVEW